MDLRYEAYCFADPLFFDELGDTGVAGDAFARDLPELPDGWVQGEENVWRVLGSVTRMLPAQGWKIHVSAHLDNATRVLAKVYAYCVDRQITFKHVRSRTMLLTRNSKYAERQGSGKFVTIYPIDNVELEQVLRELSEELAGESGPYILSDLRYGDGPLYVRYGGFVRRWVEHEGTRVLAIAAPDGTLVPDRREPKFSTPEWVELPECLKPHLAARSSGDPSQFPYQVSASLHFSNGGGVYLAKRNADGVELVLKEARPYAGLDGYGTDAVARLHREHAMLSRLAGVPGVPEVYELFPVWEHQFLAMAHVAGIPLGKWMAQNYPLVRRDCSQADLDEYARRALAVLDDIIALVARVHERGVVFGDLHGQNVLVDSGSDTDTDTDNGATVSLIDFELSFPVTETARPGLGAPGFRSPADRTGFAVDEYALAALRLWLFLPLNTILELAPGKLDGMVELIERRFRLPAGYGDSIRAQLAPRTSGRTAPAVSSALREIEAPDPDWSVVRKSIAEAILASATPRRTDRLFPGDPEQFQVGGACFGYGAAGVLHALDAAGFGRYPEHERWLLDSVRRDPPKRPGFFDGAHGIAYVLENFGHAEAASELLAGTADLVEQTIDHDLSGGLAGIGLTRLHFAGTRNDDAFLRQACDTAERLASALQVAPPPDPRFGRAGLLQGWSGPAVLFTRLYARTGERRWLDLADQALARDLEECEPVQDGSLQVRDGTRRMLPYVSIGSAGIAMAAELLAEQVAGLQSSDDGSHNNDADYASLRQLPGLRAACCGEFVIFPGLVYGRAGQLAALAMGLHRGPAAPEPFVRETREAIAVHLAALAWHAVPYGGGLAFPGANLLRLSMDVNTGGAGVLLALGAALDGHGTALPFLDAPSHELADQA
jgi:serine/threonine protein kinase